MPASFRAAWFATVGVVIGLSVAAVATIPFILILTNAIEQGHPLSAAYGAALFAWLAWVVLKTLALAQGRGSIPSEISTPASALGATLGLLVGVGLMFGHWLTDFVAPPNTALPYIVVPAGLTLLGAAAGAAVPPASLAGHGGKLFVLAMAFVGAIVMINPAIVIGRPYYARASVPMSSAATSSPPALSFDISPNYVRGLSPDGVLYVNDYHSLQATDPFGAPRWSLSGKELDGSVTAGPEGDAIVTGNSSVTRVDGFGHVQWNYDPSPERVTVLGVTADGTTYTMNTRWAESRTTQVIRAIDRSGAVRDVLANAPVAGNLLLRSDGALLVRSEGDLVLYDQRGSLLWRKAVRGAFGRITDDAIYLIDGSSIVALDGEGQRRWQVALNGLHRNERINTLVAGPSGRVYAVATQIWAVEQGRELWRWNETSIDDRVVADTDGAVYARDKQSIYAIDSTGRLRWIWRPDTGRPYFGERMWLAPGQTLLVGEGNRIVAIDLAGRFGRGAVR